MNWANQFKPTEIVCLDNHDLQLYAEVIQVVVERQTCWVRPLFLVASSAADGISTEGESSKVETRTFYDLRQGADLLLPTVLFRSALDTEVVPLLSQLPHKISARESEAGRQAHQQLRQLVCQICKIHPDLF
ncbi:MAG: hypothetical protein KME16_22740 [Scytolyngbya sp. HA4215-MV1]|nr:hypothetical protein [Scytolyngbya sp. HA4215-MV1]